MHQLVHLVYPLFYNNVDLSKRLQAFYTHTHTNFNNFLLA